MEGDAGTTGTARGQSQLRQAFVFTNSYAMPQPEVLVRLIEKWGEQRKAAKLGPAETQRFIARHAAGGRSSALGGGL